MLKNEVFVHTSLELLMGSHTVEKKHLNWIPKPNHPEINNNNIPRNIPQVKPAVAILPENNSANQIQANGNLLYQTRSGRNVQPPLRYGQT